MTEDFYHSGVFSPTHDALNRMKRAYDRGTGCHLTADMINSLAVTVVGSMWDEEDPRQSLTHQHRGESDE